VQVEGQIRAWFGDRQASGLSGTQVFEEFVRNELRAEINDSDRCLPYQHLGVAMLPLVWRSMDMAAHAPTMGQLARYLSVGATVAWLIIPLLVAALDKVARIVIARHQRDWSEDQLNSAIWNEGFLSGEAKTLRKFAYHMLPRLLAGTVVAVAVYAPCLGLWLRFVVHHGAVEWIVVATIALCATVYKVYPELRQQRGMIASLR